jgi:hypothetical protein
MFFRTFAPIVLAATVLSGCAVAPEDLESSAAEKASAASAFTFYLPALKNGHASLVRLDGAPMRCPNGRKGWQCSVDGLDFTTMGISPIDAAALAGRLSDDPWSSPIVLVGALDSVGGATRTTTLRVYEAWQAPTRIALDGEAFHVSHAGKQIVNVDGFARVKTTALDFSGAPDDKTCERQGGCGGARAFATSAAQTQTGLLVVGNVGRDGVLRATQFFRKIDVGQQHEIDGAWLCLSSQVACTSGDCAPDEATCHHQTGDGRGLMPITHAMWAPFVGWLRQTGLVGATELLDQPKPM